MTKKHLSDPRRADYTEVVDKFRVIKPDPLIRASATKLDANKTTTVESGLEPYTGDWTEDHIARFLKRLLFGVKKSELVHFSTLSFDQAMAEVMMPSEPITPPVNDYEGLDGLSDPNVPKGETWITAPFTNETSIARIITLKAWMVKNIVTQKSSMFEKMVLFWHNLLVTEIWSVFIPKMSYDYIELIRKNCLGNFKTMIRELTVNPAMLLYLNGTFNTKEAADENYGRELQELFCVGKGPGSGYTESDVQTAARVLTGWELNWEDIDQARRVGSGFTPSRHDTGDKVFSEFYGNRVIQGKSGAAGGEELDELLDMIFEANETAVYICRRIYGFFVNGAIDENAEQNVIQPLAEIFRNNDFEIRPVLEALVKSAHFHDMLLEGAIIKSPAEFLYGIWRSMEMQYPDPNDLAKLRLTHAHLHWAMVPLGMEIGDPPGVAGWTAYYQAPLYDKTWITAGSIVSRARLTDEWTFSGFTLDEEHTVPMDLLAFVDRLHNGQDPNALIQETSQLLLGISASESLRNELKSILLSGQDADSYWTDAWLTYKNNPSEENRSIVENRLKSTFQALFQLPEFQLT